MLPQRRHQIARSDHPAVADAPLDVPFQRCATGSPARWITTPASRRLSAGGRLHRIPRHSFTPAGTLVPACRLSTTYLLSGRK